MSGAKALAGQRMHAAVCGATMVAESARAAAVALKVRGPASDASRSTQTPQAKRAEFQRIGREQWGHYLYIGRDDGETLYVGFGKHKGTPLADVDPDFVRWMRTLGDVPDHVMAKFEEAVA